MNPHAGHEYKLTALWQSIYRNRTLLYQLTRREIAGRYRGSALGISWALFQPILMLCVYTFVFSVVLKTTWRRGLETDTTSFAIILFSGLMVHGLFAECFLRAPTIFLHNVNLVKKVVFPLEILPLVALGSAFFNLAVNLLILFGAMLLSGLEFHASIFYFPLVLIPFSLLVLGITWIVSAIGVYLRDLGHAAGIITTILLFISPVFFPISAIPEQFRTLIYMNPLSFIIDQFRAVILWGEHPHWLWLSLYGAAGFAVFCLGFFFFQYTRKGFCDVL